MTPMSLFIFFEKSLLQYAVDNHEYPLYYGLHSQTTLLFDAADINYYLLHNAVDIDDYPLHYSVDSQIVSLHNAMEKQITPLLYAADSQCWQWIVKSIKFRILIILKETIRHKNITSHKKITPSIKFVFDCLMHYSAG
jgi:hypothetical protein